MNLTFNRRYDKWKMHRAARERCEHCMFDAPNEEMCCKHHCGEYDFCEKCTAKCRVGAKLCENRQ